MRVAGLGGYRVTNHRCYQSCNLANDFVSGVCFLRGRPDCERMGVLERGPDEAPDRRFHGFDHGRQDRRAACV